MICPACEYNPDLVVTASYEITLPCKWYSANELRSNTRHNRKYKRIRDDYYKKLQIHARVPPADSYRRVFFQRIYGYGPSGRVWCKPFDKINYAAGGKPLLDGLVRSGFLIDDKPEYCDDYYLPQLPSSDGKHYITIRIEDVSRPTKA